MKTLTPIATAASTNETITPRRYGRRNPRSRKNVCTCPLTLLSEALPDRAVAEVEDRGEVARDQQPPRERAERPERQRVADGVAHHGAAAGVRLEVVRVVPEPVG